MPMLVLIFRDGNIFRGSLVTIFRFQKIDPAVGGIESHPRDLEMVTRNRFSREIIVRGDNRNRL